MQTEETKTPEKTGRERVRARLDELKTLRDQIRVKLHLAGMDVRDSFRKIEPAVDKAEHEVTHMAQDATDAVAKTLDALANSLRMLRVRIPK